MLWLVDLISHGRTRPMPAFARDLGVPQRHFVFVVLTWSPSGVLSRLHFRILYGKRPEAPGAVCPGSEMFLHPGTARVCWLGAVLNRHLQFVDRRPHEGMLEFIKYVEARLSRNGLGVMTDSTASAVQPGRPADRHGGKTR